MYLSILSFSLFLPSFLRIFPTRAEYIILLLNLKYCFLGLLLQFPLPCYRRMHREPVKCFFFYLFFKGSSYIFFSANLLLSLQNVIRGEIYFWKDVFLLLNCVNQRNYSYEQDEMNIKKWIFYPNCYIMRIIICIFVARINKRSFGKVW